MICIEGESFFINDLMKQHGDFLSYNELVELYPNLRVNFLEYAGLINSV